MQDSNGHKNPIIPLFLFVFLAAGLGLYAAVQLDFDLTKRIFAPAPEKSVNNQYVSTTPGAIVMPDGTMAYSIEPTPTLSGSYLSSLFAQRRHDWTTARTYLNDALKVTPDNLELLRKSMVLAMGSGQLEEAAAIAEKVLAHAEADESQNMLALIFLVTKSFHDQNYEGAKKFTNKMPESSLSGFIKPLLKSWAQAGLGKNETDKLQGNTIHLYHAILITAYMEQPEAIENLLETALQAESLSVQDVERIADVYAYSGNTEKAMDLYQQSLEFWPDNPSIIHKLSALKNGDPVNGFKTVKKPEQGTAQAFYDMARLLSLESSDDSARIFANMALALWPEMTDAKLLLANITARNDRFDKAIDYYLAIAPEDEHYLEARRNAANLLEDSNRIDEALAQLNALVKDHGDVESMIQIGDMYRRKQDFKSAVLHYNEAEEKLGTKVPQEYWRLHYVRGMSYERLGEWDRAEADLKTALDLQPNHPDVLNYLGYSWADQGIKLEDSLELIRKAAAMRPTDGYIIDSLGWVLYQMGRYEEAVPHLEKAVELEPYDPVINDHLGDSYWQVGRKIEARFQWLRAKNHSEEEDLTQQITAKLDHGLKSVEAVKEAHSRQSTDGPAETVGDIANP